ncbi:hypothetical protein [Nocardia sp. SYP-A9097]|nr:hypothetical protein [Nocardia sp. SYP-A9097]
MADFSRCALCESPAAADNRFRTNGSSESPQSTVADLIYHRTS